MDRFSNLLPSDVTDLLFGFALFLAVYLIARLMKASELVSLGFAVLPVALGYLVLHPQTSYGLMSLLR